MLFQQHEVEVGKYRLNFRCDIAIAKICFVSFLVALRIVSQGYITHDNLATDSSLLIIVKKIKVIH